MESYLRPYLSLGVYGLIVLVTGGVLLSASRVLGPQRPKTPRGSARAVPSLNPTEKEAPYECGVPLLGGSRERFSVKFYLVAILFVLFDIETIFLLPWAVTFQSLGPYGVLEMLAFMAILLLGLVYAWKRGGLDWD